MDTTPDFSVMTAAEQIAWLREKTARIGAHEDNAELEARVGEVESQVREILDAMYKALDAAGLTDRPRLTLVWDADKQAG